MALVDCTVIYEDGRTETVRVGKPKHMLEVEELFGRNGSALKQGMYMAWMALGRPGAPAADAFDTWLDTVEDFDADFESARRKSDPPMAGAESSTSSPTSLLEPANP